MGGHIPYATIIPPVQVYEPSTLLGFISSPPKNRNPEPQNPMRQERSDRLLLADPGVSARVWLGASDARGISGTLGLGFRV